jgi:hypothetical protein
MSPLTRITNDKFSILICNIGLLYGFKTIGSLVKFLKQCRPDAKLGKAGGYRVAFLLTQIHKDWSHN